jgi:membrane fusion protein, heavy metal efflux system
MGSLERIGHGRDLLDPNFDRRPAISVGALTMSVAIRQIDPGTGSFRAALPWVGMCLCLAASLGYIAYDRLLASPPTAGSKASLPPPQQDGAAKPAQHPPGKLTTVTLDETKYAVAKIKLDPVRVDRIATGVSVVGQFQANSDKQVAVRPWATGIIREVRARLGQKVNRGDPLVILDSPEIGTARLNLRSKQRELSTARFEGRWKSEIAANVALLIPELRKGISERRSAVSDDDEHVETPPRHLAKPAPAIFSYSTDARLIEKQFAGKHLGTYRATLLQAYAEFDIATHEEQKQAYLRSKDIVGEHPALVARHTREKIQAQLEAAIEQVQFDSAQEERLAVQGVRLAEAAVIDAGQRLRILGVAEDIQKLLDQADLANTIARDEDVTFYRIAAPFDGTIIKKDAAFSQKADLNDVLFVVADLRSVWVTANVTESDVEKLPKLKDGSFRMSATAYPGREFSARLLSVGATVDPQTRTLPVLAQADNAEDLFKLGMFVRIHLDSSAVESVLTVPAAAAVEIDGQSVVFVPVKNSPENRSFSPRPVELGPQTGDRLVVKAGLNDGDQVVSSGGFMLKFELVLQNQADEE